MNNQQRAKLDTCNRVKEFNSRYATQLATITEYAIEQTAFNNAHTAILNAVQIQAMPSGSSTDTVQQAKETMTATTLKYAIRAMVKARQLKNKLLADSLDYSSTYIAKAPKILAVQRAKNIRDILNSNLALLTNVTAANITEITNSINNYDTIKDKPTIELQRKAATGTSPLPVAFATAFDAIENMHYLVNSYFAGINQSIVDEMTLAKQIVSTGIRYTGVKGSVTLNGSNVANATITIPAVEKLALTDANGYFSISSLKAGTYEIVAKLPSGQELSKIAQVSRGNFEAIYFDFK